MRYLVFSFVFFFFSYSGRAVPFFIGQPIFNPMFSGMPIALSAGHELMILCSYSFNLPACMGEWSSQAVPMTTYINGAPETEYYLPAFIDEGSSDIDPRSHDDWDLFVTKNPVAFKSSEGTYDRTFYQNKNNSQQFIVVEEKPSGEATISKVKPVLVREQDIQVGKKKSDDSKSDQMSISAWTNKDTMTLPATTKEVKPGCFIIDKPDEQTEAGYCLDCYHRDSRNSPLMELFEDPQFRSNLERYMIDVRQTTRRKIINKIDTGNEPYIEKICSPNKSVGTIISNFNRTCPHPYKNNFNKFFKDSYCHSCKKGVPPELMLSMMSIESAGECLAQRKNDLEESIGLFQVENKQHSCTDHQSGRTYSVGSATNLQCLKDPVNSLNKGADIVVEKYGLVNDQLVTGDLCSADQPSWLRMGREEKNKWRRAVSAYNGGEKWVTRAIKSVRERKARADGTSYLVNARSSEYKTDSADWEDLRVYFFMEKLLPTNTTGSGRKISNTVLNLAHTESVLGRSVRGASPAMVDIWSQYIIENKDFSCP